MSWKPITKEELERELEAQCDDLSPEEMRYFSSIRVPLESVKIDRNGSIENVYIVARQQQIVIFYEDVEEGFEITKLNSQGVIDEYGANQFTIRHVINQLRARNS